MGLLGRVAAGVATTAVVAGTATAVRNRVSRRQTNRWQKKADAQGYEQQQAAAPTQYQQPPQYQQPLQYQQPPIAQQGPPPTTGAPDLVDELQRLGSLKEQGLLTEGEFTAAKNKMLGI